MTVNTQIILSNTVHGTPSGNYDGSSLTFVSDAAKAVGYYRGQGSIETVFIQVTGFDGIITLQATLDEDPSTIDSELGWFDVYTYDAAGETRTDYHPAVLTGNFTWIRAVVTQFEAGTINSITTTY